MHSSPSLNHLNPNLNHLRLNLYKDMFLRFGVRNPNFWSQLQRWFSLAVNHGRWMEKIPPQTLKKVISVVSLHNLDITLKMWPIFLKEKFVICPLNIG